MRQERKTIFYFSNVKRSRRPLNSKNKCEEKQNRSLSLHSAYVDVNGLQWCLLYAVEFLEKTMLNVSKRSARNDRIFRISLVS